MTRKLRGRVHGKRIELIEHPGVADGQEIDLVIEVASTLSWGEGIRRSAGGWANQPEMDDILERIHEGRKLERNHPAE